MRTVQLDPDMRKRKTHLLSSGALKRKRRILVRNQIVGNKVSFIKHLQLTEYVHSAFARKGIKI